jgi:hypothetical protein
MRVSAVGIPFLSRITGSHQAEVGEDVNILFNDDDPGHDFLLA